MLRLRPWAAVGLLLLMVLAAPAGHDVAVADGLPRQAPQPRQAAAAPPPAADERAPVGTDAADADVSDGAIALLLAAFGAVCLMASRLRRPD